MIGFPLSAICSRSQWKWISHIILSYAAEKVFLLFKGQGPFKFLTKYPAAKPKKTNTKKPTQPPHPPQLDALGLSAAVARIPSAKSGSTDRNLSSIFNGGVGEGGGVFRILKTLQLEVSSKRTEDSRFCFSFAANKHK
jgi:hypothetical protein